MRVLTHDTESGRGRRTARIGPVGKAAEYITVAKGGRTARVSALLPAPTLLQGRTSLAYTKGVGRATLRFCPTLFPEARRFNGFGIACPIWRIDTVFHEAMKARMGPIRYTGDIPVFDRIVVEVVAMAFEIPLITNLVFPIAVLPDGLFSLVLEGGRAGGFERGGATAGEMGFDQHPAG